MASDSLLANFATQRAGTALLLLGAFLVGIAIILDGTVARFINGVGGLLWFASAGLLLLVAIRSKPARVMWLALAILTIAVAFVIKPSALIPTLIGFIPVGFVIASIGPRNRILWATLIPAWYLPAHIGTAVANAAIRSTMGTGASLRTDPPPTAAFVPALMVVCAMAGGYLALGLARRTEGRNAAHMDQTN